MVRSHGVTLINRLARRSSCGANNSVRIFSNSFSGCFYEIWSSNCDGNSHLQVYQAVFQRGYRTLNSGPFNPSRVTGTFASNGVC